MKFMRNGNVLFLILLAVALFAALSFAVTQSGRGGGNNISQDQAELAVSQIMQFGSSITSTIERLRLSNGCRLTQISFASDSDRDGNWFDTDDLYHNTSSPTDFSCHVFHPNGGNQTLLEIEDDWLDSTHSASSIYKEVFFTGGTCVYAVGTGAQISGQECWRVGDDAELMFFINALKDPICKNINFRWSGLERIHLEFNTLHGDPDAVTAAGRFTGSFRVGSNSVVDSSTGGFHGKNFGCLQSINDLPGYPTGSNSLFYVLVPR